MHNKESNESICQLEGKVMRRGAGGRGAGKSNFQFNEPIKTRKNETKESRVMRITESEECAAYSIKLIRFLFFSKIYQIKDKQFSEWNFETEIRKICQSNRNFPLTTKEYLGYCIFNSAI